MSIEPAKPVIILDRDGVINHDSPDYIKSADEWRPLAGSCNAIAQLSKHGYKIAVATNQSGLGRQLYNEDTYRDIERTMLAAVAKAGGTIDYIAFCPHIPEDACLCRKPKPGMILEIASHFQIDCEQCIFVGDSRRDIDAARAAGCQPALVLTGNGYKTRNYGGDILKGVEIFTDLAAFASQFVQNHDS